MIPASSGTSRAFLSVAVTFVGVDEVDADRLGFRVFDVIVQTQNDVPVLHLFGNVDKVFDQGHAKLLATDSTERQSPSRKVATSPHRETPVRLPDQKAALRSCQAIFRLL